MALKEDRFLTKPDLHLLLGVTQLAQTFSIRESEK
jgi:hypothetical protein